MSEEEKIAMLELNRYVYGKQLSKDDIVDYMSILFGLIHRQQNEIEQLNEIKQQICNEELITQDYVQENFIKKDKIREKIKEIENVETDKISREEYNRIDFAIETLQELLEEK